MARAGTLPENTYFEDLTPQTRNTTTNAANNEDTIDADEENDGYDEIL